MAGQANHTAFVFPVNIDINPFLTNIKYTNQAIPDRNGLIII